MFKSVLRSAMLAGNKGMLSNAGLWKGNADVMILVVQRLVVALPGEDGREGHNPAQGCKQVIRGRRGPPYIPSRTSVLVSMHCRQREGKGTSAVCLGTLRANLFRVS